MEKFKEVVESLGDKVSCWKITKEHGLKWLNRTTATCKNMRMLFWCKKCGQIHAIELEDLAMDENGDYWGYCPNRNVPEQWIKGDKIPEELEEIFQTINSDCNCGSDGNCCCEGSCCCHEHDCEEEEGTVSPAERIIKSGAGGIIRA